MKYLPILLLLFLLTNQTFRQSGQEFAIDSALNARTSTKVENFKGKYKFVKEHWDLLNSGIIQANWQLGTKKNLKRIGLLTLTYNSEIIYSEVYRWDLNMEYTDWEHEILNTKSNENGKLASVIPEHLVRLPYRSTFGYMCGAGASMPKEGNLMMRLVEGSNNQELINWLNSVNPVRQAYAYLGLSLLEANGTKIEFEVKNKMNNLKHNDFQIYSCYGCMAGERSPLSGLLNEEQVSNFIRRNVK